MGHSLRMVLSEDSTFCGLEYAFGQTIEVVDHGLHDLAWLLLE